MKRFSKILAIALLSVCLFCTLFGGASAADSYKISLTQEQNGIYVDVTVNLEENSGLNTVMVKVEYNEKALRFVEPFFSSDNVGFAPSTITYRDGGKKDPDNAFRSGDTIYFEALDDSVTGTGEMIVLRFVAIGLGDKTVTVSIDQALKKFDSKNPVSAEILPAQIEVKSTAWIIPTVCGVVVVLFVVVILLKVSASKKKQAKKKK